MIDLTQCSDNELSLNVFNDEGLYNLRRSAGFIDMLDEVYTYSTDQLEVLIKDLEDDANE